MGLSTGSVAYVKLPSNGDNPLMDSNVAYAPSGSLYMPADDWQVGGMKWNLSTVILEAEGLSATTTVQVWERRDLGTWTSLGTVSTNGRTVINTTGDKRFNRCELRLDVVNGASTSTPVIRVLVGRATRRPGVVDVVKTRVYASDAVLSRFGIPTRYTGQDLIDQLKTLDEYYPITLVDYWTGSKRTRTVLAMPIVERMTKQDGDDAAEQAIDLTLKVIS